MRLTEQEKRDYDQKGYLILRQVKELMPHIAAMKREILALGRSFISTYHEEADGEEIAKLSPHDRKAFYSVLRYLPSLTQLASSPLLLELSQEFDLRMPAVMHSYNIRMDGPNEDKFLFHWHQDITYLLGSKNSVTYWIPLSPVDELHGSIEVIDGRNNNELYPYYYTGQEPIPLNKPMAPRDIKLRKEPTLKGDIVEATSGDIVAFSQFVLHRSTPNRSNRFRWVSQVRHSDLAEPGFRESGYPFGDQTNIFAVSYLKTSDSDAS